MAQRRYMVVTVNEVSAESEDEARMLVDNKLCGAGARYTQKISVMKPYHFHWVSVVVADMDIVKEGFELTSGRAGEVADWFTETAKLDKDTTRDCMLSVIHSPVDELIKEVQS